MVTVAMMHRIMEDERVVTPLPVQAFADDNVASADSVSTLESMIEAGEPRMKDAGLDVKVTKCTCFYGRRSGINWYTGKRDVVQAVSIQGNALTTHQRKEPYKYLGKSLSLFGEDEEQIAEFISEYKILVGKIKLCKLPLSLKSAALNNLALAKILHHFYNTRLSEKQLNDLDHYLTENVRELYDFYKSTAQLIIYLPRENGGIGIKKLSDVYYVTRLSFLINILNHQVPEIRNVARSFSRIQIE